MARPSKYNWEAIKEAFNNGFDRDEICKKYNITPKILSNRINQDKWEVKGTLKTDIIGLSEQVHKTAQNITKLYIQNQELATDVFNTNLEDKELIINNRRIARVLQNTIMSNKEDITLKNIKNISSTLKDIENIANPKPEIFINNSNQHTSIQNNDTPLSLELAKKEALALGVPLEVLIK